MQRPFIKAGQLTNLTDARYYAAMDVKWLGFLFEENNEKSLSVELFRAIKSWIEGPEIIAEIGFVENAEAYVSDIYDEVDGFQVKAFQVVPEKWFEDEKVIIREIKSQEQLSDSIFDAREILLLDTGSSSFSQDHLNKNKIIFDIPESREALVQWVEANEPFAIQIKGSEEEKVGFKSYDEIDAFFDYFEESA